MQVGMFAIGIGNAARPELIAAIAIPSLLRSRIAANEASAAGRIRTLTTAETPYAQTLPYVRHTCTLSELRPPAPGVGQRQDGDAIG